MYEKFQEVDGTHPWRNVSPDGYVDYRARYRPQGRVVYFNFPLAKEMGLIPADHPTSINKNQLSGSIPPKLFSSEMILIHM